MLRALALAALLLSALLPGGMFPGTAHAAAPAPQPERAVDIDLRPFTEILVDKDGTLGIRDITSGDRPVRFTRQRGKRPGAPRMERPRWMRVSLPGNLRSPLILWAKGRFPRDCTLYVPQNGGQKGAASFRRMEKRGQNIAFRLPDDMPLPATLYLKISAGGPTRMPLRLFSPDAFLRHTAKAHLLSGGFLGIILIYALLNILFYSAFRQPHLLWYGCSLASLCLIDASGEGLWELFLGPLPKGWWLTLTVLPAALFMALSGGFTRSFLDTRARAPKADLLLKCYMAGVLGVAVLAALSGHPKQARLMLPFLVVLPFITTLSGYVCWKKGFSPARFFMLGWLFYLAGPLLMFLRLSGIVFPAPFQALTFKTGTFLQMIVFTAALLDHVRAIQRERKALEKARDSADSILRTQRSLFRDISHELSSPLSRIAIALDMLRGKTGGNAARDIGQAEKDTGRLFELQQQMLMLARLQSGLEWNKEDLDLKELALEVAQHARYEGAQRNCEITVSGPAARIHGSPELLRRALENLVRNALRYGGDGNRVHIELHAPEAGGACVRVRDRGPGVPEEHLDELFTPFFRVKNPSPDAPRGTGLGLAIARHAARTHGGDVRARNAEGGGLTVEMRLG